MTLEEREILSQLFDKFKNLLTQTQKQALELYLIEDVSISEIGEIMATSRQAAHDSIKKASAKLFDIENNIE